MRSFLIAITASLIILSGFITVGVTHEFDETKASNLVTFAKAYGYVKYFHPSDEAANIDWNNFAAFGAQEVLNCKNESELIGKLKDLFGPIAPGIVFSKTKVEYDFQKITPKNIDDYLPTYWQHKGVSTGMNMRGNTYKSVRVNRQASDRR